MKVVIQNLQFSYRNFSLYVSELNLESSRVTTVIGPNGAGKTTFLKCLGGILPIGKKTVFVDGKDLVKLTGNHRARRICYVPQELVSVFNYNVLDFVLMGRAAYISPFSSPSEEDRAAAEEALSFVGMEEYRKRQLFELSSGERRLILIARALAQKAEVLLFDEPTTFLDPRHEIEVLELIRKLSSEKGKTLVLTLHDLEMATSYSDTLVFMKNGNIVASGKTEEILSESLLEEIYEIKMSILEFNGRKFIVKTP